MRSARKTKHEDRSTPISSLLLKASVKGSTSNSTGLRAGIDRLLPRNVPLLGGSLVISFKKGIGISTREESMTLMSAFSQSMKSGIRLALLAKQGMELVQKGSKLL